MNRIKDRVRRKAALGDRKSALAQARMKNIATLAADDRVPKKKRKAGGGKVTLRDAVSVSLMFSQRTCSERMMMIGLYIAKLCVCS